MDKDNITKPADKSEYSSTQNDLEYLSSLLHELKNLADNSGHKLLYHLINMAEIEATDILEREQEKVDKN